jgi:hypothetical protein
MVSNGSILWHAGTRVMIDTDPGIDDVAYI